MPIAKGNRYHISPANIITGMDSSMLKSIFEKRIRLRVIGMVNKYQALLPSLAIKGNKNRRKNAVAKNKIQANENTVSCNCQVSLVNRCPIPKDKNKKKNTAIDPKNIAYPVSDGFLIIDNQSLKTNGILV